MQSNCSVTSVVSAISQVNGIGQNYPLTKLTPLNRLSPNIAHMIMSTKSAHMVKIVPGGHFSPYSQSYHPILSLSLYAKCFRLSRWTHFYMRHTSRCISTHGSAFRGLQQKAYLHNSTMYIQQWNLANCCCQVLGTYESFRLSGVAGR